MKNSLIILLVSIASLSTYAAEPGPCAALTKREGYYKFLNKNCDSFNDGEMGVVPYETNAPEGPGSVIMAAGVSLLIPYSLVPSIKCEETDGKLVVTACIGQNDLDCSTPAVYTFVEKNAQVTAGDCKAEYLKDHDYTP